MPLVCSIGPRNLGDLGDRRAEDLVLVIERRRSDVDIEPVGADHPVAFVEKLVADHHDMVHLALGVDDPVPGGERTRRAADLVQSRGHLAIVLGVLVGQHEFGRRFDGARLVAVHPLDLR